MPSVASERLEDALQTYEDLCRVHEPMGIGMPADKVGKTVPAHEGALANWRKMRKGLLDGTKNIFSGSDWKIPPCEEEMPVYNILGAMASFPLELHQWMHHSRRVFAVDTSLQEFLYNGDYSQLHWGQIVFPFPSFVIELGKPILDGPENDPYLLDALLVSWYAPTDQTGGFLRIRFFQKKPLDRKGFLKQSDRQRHEVDMGRRQILRLGERYGKLFKQKDAGRDFMQGAFQTALALKAGEDPLIQILPEDFLRMHDATEFAAHAYSLATKVVIGLSLYLVHMSAKSEPAEWSQSKSSRSGPLNIITDEAYICRVVSKGVFDPAVFRPESDGKLRGGFEMPPHHRRAHMRRPRGSSPNAAKTVRVEAAFIHKDRMPPSGVAGGTRTEVRFDD